MVDNWPILWNIGGEEEGNREIGDPGLPPGADAAARWSTCLDTPFRAAIDGPSNSTKSTKATSGTDGMELGSRPTKNF